MNLPYPHPIGGKRLDSCLSSSKKKGTGKLDPTEEEVFANKELLAIVAACVFGRFLLSLCWNGNK